MLKESFSGRNPSHFVINPIVKAYILSESFVWSAWNFVIPIFAIFIVTEIPGADVQMAAFGYSVYLLSRVLFELITGKLLTKSTDREKILTTLLGLGFITAAYLGFAISSSLFLVYFFYFIAGIGLGIASPAKNALFSIHLDKNKEAAEWGIADGLTFGSMALAAALGGFMAQSYGFDILFQVCAGVNILGMIPYVLYLGRKKVSN